MSRYLVFCCRFWVFVKAFGSAKPTERERQIQDPVGLVPPNVKIKSGMRRYLVFCCRFWGFVKAFGSAKPTKMMMNLRFRRFGTTKRQDRARDAQIFGILLQVLGFC